MHKDDADMVRFHFTANLAEVFNQYYHRDNKRQAFEDWDTYFTKYWTYGLWRGTYEEYSRRIAADKLNTNNMEERLFRSFDDVFLQGRHAEISSFSFVNMPIGMNYRVERLVRIICNEIFPYFQFCRQHYTPYQQEPFYIRTSRDAGFRIWLAGMVEPLDRCPHHFVVGSMTDESQTYVVDVRGAALRTSRPCGCAYSIANNGSRLCKHYFAAQAQCLYGPVKELAFRSKLPLQELMMEARNNPDPDPPEERMDIGMVERLVLQTPVPIDRIMELTNHIINSGGSKRGVIAERMSVVITKCIQQCDNETTLGKLVKLNARLIADKYATVVAGISPLHQDKMRIVLQKHLTTTTPKVFALHIMKLCIYDMLTACCR